MKRIFFVTVFLFYLCLIFVAHKNTALADTTNSDPNSNFPCQKVDPPTSYNEKDPPTYEINNLPVNDNPDCLYNLYDFPETRINGNTRSIWVQFVNLDPKKTYYLCNQQNVKNCAFGANLYKLNPKPSGTITLNVCGADSDSIKGAQVDTFGSHIKSGGVIDEECVENRDYFHEGRTYRIAVYPSKNAAVQNGANNLTSDLITAQFFVAHSYPLVKVNSTDAFREPIDITLWGRRPGGDNANNYQVVVEGTDNKYKNGTCYTIPGQNADQNQTVGINTQYDGQKDQVVPEFILNGTGFGIPTARDAGFGKTNHFGRGGDKDASNLGKGTYIIKINERVNDERPLGLGSHCEGGTTYMHVFFQITNDSTNPIKILKVQYDPHESDTNKIENVVPVPPPPCAEGEFDKDTGTCKAFDVALLGKVKLEPLPFIKSVYTIVLSIAGVAAVAIIIMSGYKLMYSRGDKEMIADARSRITSAIIGLLFIVFAYVILSIIGVDILKIPGFG